MGKVSWNSATIKWGDTSATLATIGGYDVSMPKQAEIIDVSDSESTAREVLAALKQHGLSFSKWFNDSDTPYDEGDSVHIQLVLGTKTYYGDFVCESANLDGAKGDAYRWSYVFQADGAIAVA